MTKLWGKVVEVRKSEAATTWYHAVVVSEARNGDAVRVRFPRKLEPLAGGVDSGICAYEQDKYVWTEKVVAPIATCVRERARPSAEGTWEPAVDELVELNFEANGYYPGGWALGRVAERRDDFFFVRFEPDKESGFTQDQKTVIVRKNVLRRAGTRTPICEKFIKKLVTLPDPEDLHAHWLFTPDGQEVLLQLKKKLELVFVLPPAELLVERDEVGEKTQFTEIALYSGGDDERSKTNAEQAALLLQIHWHHQTRIQAFTRERARKLEELEQLRIKAERGLTMSREVPDAVVGFLVGKQGKKIQNLQEKYDVEIKVSTQTDGAPRAGGAQEASSKNTQSGAEATSAATSPSDVPAPPQAEPGTSSVGTSSSSTSKAAAEQKMRRVTVFGTDAEAVRAAFEETDLTYSELKLTTEQAKFLRSKCQFTTLMQDTGVAFAGFNQKSGATVEIMGKAEEVEEARMIVESHLEYFGTYQTMDDAFDALRSEEETFAREFGGPGKGNGRRSNASTKEATTARRSTKKRVADETNGRPSTQAGTGGGGESEQGEEGDGAVKKGRGSKRGGRGRGAAAKQDGSKGDASTKGKSRSSGRGKETNGTANEDAEAEAKHKAPSGDGGEADATAGEKSSTKTGGNNRKSSAKGGGATFANPNEAAATPTDDMKNRHDAATANGNHKVALGGE
ncbi:unnamed protein product [Amoebophrya sp. A25]|nr:unnamed protein product [Amoebophrya sp. A25]|eukprot:GSA25T00001122001.1